MPSHGRSLPSNRRGVSGTAATIREAEKVKTREHHELLADIFKHGKIDFLPKEDDKLALRERGLNDKEVHDILIEAERDYVLRFASQGFGPDYNLVRMQLDTSGRAQEGG